MPKSWDARGVIATWVFSSSFFLKFFFLCVVGAGMLGTTPIPVGARLLLLGMFDPSSMSVCLSSFVLFFFATFYSMRENCSVSAGEDFFCSNCLV